MNKNKKFFSKIGFNYLILALSALIFQIILVNVIFLMDQRLLANFNFSVILIAVCNYILPLPILLYLMKKIDSQTIEKHSLTVKKFLKYIAINITLLWIGNIIGIMITMAIGGLTQTDIANPIQNLIDTTDIWLNVVLISLIGPIFEEFFFRKLLIDRTIKYGARVSIIISAVLFAFVHGNINQFFYAFLLGGFLAYVYIRTGNIIYPILLHIFTNFMGSVVSTFVGQSAEALVSGGIPVMSLAIIVIYFIILIILVLIGLISLFDYKKYKFNGEKTRIALDHPFKTMFLNYGMICFMIYYIIFIINQLMG